MGFRTVDTDEGDWTDDRRRQRSGEQQADELRMIVEISEEVWG